MVTKQGLARLVLGAVAVSSMAPSSARAEELPPPRLPDSQHFTIDPVVDGVLVVGGETFDELLSLIVSTGEIKPQPPTTPVHLLGIDQIAVTQNINPNAAVYSNVGLWTAYGYAVLDPLVSGFRDGRRAMLVDAILYAESISITGALTEATKIAVRRPRPIDYALCSEMAPLPSSPTTCANTDLQLSFFSGHASTTAAITATATYLAFARSGWRRPRPWLTLALGTMLTAFVSYMRVRSGEHFPTDVIMGSMAGAGIGVLVPHFHRRPHYHDRELESAPVLIGYAPAPGGGGTMTLQWHF